MLPPQSVAAVKGLHQNELILRYSGLTRAELALGASAAEGGDAPD